MEVSSQGYLPLSHCAGYRATTTTLWFCVRLNYGFLCVLYLCTSAFWIPESIRSFCCIYHRIVYFWVWLRSTRVHTTTVAACWVLQYFVCLMLMTKIASCVKVLSGVNEHNHLLHSLFCSANARHTLCTAHPAAICWKRILSAAMWGCRRKSRWQRTRPAISSSFRRIAISEENFHLLYFILLYVVAKGFVPLISFHACRAGIGCSYPCTNTRFTCCYLVQCSQTNYRCIRSSAHHPLDTQKVGNHLKYLVDEDRPHLPPSSHPDYLHFCE